MEKLTIQIFTDPMMGLSYESEPVFRTLDTIRECLNSATGWGYWRGMCLISWIPMT